MTEHFWFASAESRNFVQLTLEQEFVMAIKGNRKMALSGGGQKKAVASEWAR